MGGKFCFLLGLCVLFVFIVSAENEEKDLSQENVSLRLIRSADSKRKKSRNRTKNMKSKKRNKKNRKRKNKKRNKIQKKKNKNKKRNNKTKKKTNKDSRAQERMVDGKCLECAATAMNRWKTQVANFLKQKTRVEKQAAIAGKKSGKQDVFAPIVSKLIDVGGGNKSALTCSGSADSDGAKQLANLTTTLEECAMKINETCNLDTFPKPDQAMIDTCSTSVEMFETEAKKCLDLSKADTAEDACTCWTSEDMKKYTEEVKSCKIAEVSDIAKGLKDCKAEFSKCRKYEDDSIASIQSCSQSAAQLQEKVEALSANKDAMNDVKDKIATAISGSSERAPATDCAGFITLVTQSNSFIHS